MVFIIKIKQTVKAEIIIKTNFELQEETCQGNSLFILQQKMIHYCKVKNNDVFLEC